MVSRVGDIVFDRRSMMGWGPTGTVVLRGTYGDEPVAVKRFISRHLKLDAGDFQTYRSDYHVNILPLLDVTTFSGFTYFALELCACNLTDYINGKYEGPPISNRSVLRQASEGLSHLHSLGVIHRALKPSNILISLPSERCPEVTVKLADFGSSPTWNETWPGGNPDHNEGYLSPEQLRSGPQAMTLTSAVDVFALGCLFHLVLTGGHHPFGPLPYFRDQKIMAGQYDLSALTSPAAELIQGMIQRLPENRPSMEDILSYEDFWAVDF